jgi:hypothetical protein
LHWLEVWRAEQEQLGMINGGLSGAALQKAQNKAAEMSVRGVTAMSVKIPITKLLKMVYLL